MSQRRRRVGPLAPTWVVALVATLALGGAFADEDLVVARARDCAQHLKTTFATALDDPQAACLERRIRATPGYDSSNTVDCEKQLQACGVGRENCLAQVERKYGVPGLASALGLDVTADYQAARACIARDATRMSLANILKYCDNVLKVHCSGLDLITEISDGLLARCQRHLAATLGVDPQHDAARMRCLERGIFDRYSRNGEVADEASCKKIFQEDCAAPASATAP